MCSMGGEPNLQRRRIEGFCSSSSSSNSSSSTVVMNFKYFLRLDTCDFRTYFMAHIVVNSLLLLYCI